jgi:Septum formation
MRTHRPTSAALVGAVLTVLVLAGGACSGDDDDEEAGRDDTSETTSAESEDDTSETTSAEAEEATVFQLEEGDCLTSDPSVQGEVSEVPKVDCEEPHFSEVFHTYTIDADALPSAADMEGIVEDQCLAEFETFVGMPYAESALEVTWLEPTPESWERGDRELVCMITDPAGQTTGSLEGANR